jgi:hypothetical protein
MTMSACKTFEMLDPLVQGELDDVSATAVRSHARQCSVCQHELRWLETEVRLFAQRRQTNADAPAVKTRWRFAFAAAALAAVSLLSLSQFGQGSSNASAEPLFSAPISLEVQSNPAVPVPQCSTMPQGLGFYCRRPVEVVASR